MSEDRDLKAAEYVLGTLPMEERAAAEREVASDPEFAAAVRAWDARLSPLSDIVGEVRPSPELWSSIAARLDRPSATVLPLPDPSSAARLRRSRNLWRSAALGASALAASLALVIALAPPRTGRTGEQYVAVINRSGEEPALIVRVDTAAGTVQVRSLSAEPPTGRDLELWYIGPGQTPRSMGVMDSPSRRVAMPVADQSQLERASFAVTIEPKGGSPTGGPTGPVIFSGKLIRQQP